MLDVDTGVNDVDVRARAGGAVVDVAGRGRGLVRDTAEAPWGAGLGLQSGCVDLCVFLDPGNLFACQLCEMREVLIWLLTSDEEAIVPMVVESASI